MQKCILNEVYSFLLIPIKVSMTLPFPFEIVESFLRSRTINLVYEKFEKLYVKGKKSC